jgi:translation initiation factor IF-2
MDLTLAGAVFQRWEQGLPVSEASFHKAAALLDIDPDAALTEARFKSAFSKYASENRRMTPIEKMYFGLAAGIEDPDELTKTASAYLVDQERLICRLLEQRDYLPDFEKIALMPPPEAIQEMMAQQMGSEGGAPAEGDPAAGAAGAQPDPQAAAAQAAAPQGPMQGAQLQQQPQAFRPSPTAPEQVPPGPMGNMEELLQGQQEAFGQQAEENGGLPPAGAEEPPPPAPQPEERIQQVAPGMDPETTQRYAEKLQEFEQDMGMPISDPKQMVKFVQELQKLDGKYVQEGIKQKMQQWEAEMGIGQTVDTPTVPGFGPGESGAGGAGAAGGAPAPGGGQGGPPPAAEAGAAGAGGAGGPPAAGGAAPGGAKGKGKVQPGQPLPAAVAAGKAGGQQVPPGAEKVAQAARRLAHAHTRV